MELELGSLVELREVLEQTKNAIFGRRKEKTFFEKYEQNPNIEELIDSARAGLLAGPVATQVTRRNPLDSGSDSDDAGLIGAG